MERGCALRVSTTILVRARETWCASVQQEYTKEALREGGAQTNNACILHPLSHANPKMWCVLVQVVATTSGKRVSESLQLIDGPRPIVCERSHATVPAAATCVEVGVPRTMLSPARQVAYLKQEHNLHARLVVRRNEESPLSLDRLQASG